MCVCLLIVYLLAQDFHSKIVLLGERPDSKGARLNLGDHPIGTPHATMRSYNYIYMYVYESVYI
jgi:hypothetical protein